ncbi:MAG: hypothetical protein VX127_16250 [Myxococcota bacterium]|nr:hypothetical protein [Myxococcota bacterium]
MGLKAATLVLMGFGLGCGAASRDGTPDRRVETLPWSAPDQWGPLEVGALTMRWVDARGKEMVAEVWFPAAPDAGDVPQPYPPLGLAAEAFRAVGPDSRYGPYPLVAFSHGYGGVRFQSLYLTEYLASHGHVVVSPQHRYNTFLDLNDDRLLDVIIERPGDVMEAVDEVLRRAEVTDDRLYGMVDGEQYAVMGHSFGGLTSMMVGGGRIDPDGLHARCDAGLGRLCDTMRQIDEERLAGHRMSDPRAIATVPMAPGLWYAFGNDGMTAPGLQGVRAPLVVGGDADPVLDYNAEILPSYNHMASPKTLVNFHGAGHYAFSNMCDLAPFFTDECTGDDAQWAEVDRVQRLSRTVTLAHIRTVMGDSPEDGDYTASVWLADEANVSVLHD